MIQIIQSATTYLQANVLSPLGKPASGLTVTYTVYKCSDNSIVTSGTASEIGTSGVYSFSYAFSTIGEYRLEWATPANYKNGAELISVLSAPLTTNDVGSVLTSYGAAKTSDIESIDVWGTPTEDLDVAGSIGERLKNAATVASTGDQIAAMNP